LAWPCHFLVELNLDLLKALQELLESAAILSWGVEGRLFVAVAVDLKEVFGREGSVVDFLPELKGNDGILIAVDDQKGGVDFLQPSLGIELPMNKKADPPEETRRLCAQLEKQKETAPQAPRLRPGGGRPGWWRRRCRGIGRKK
jgi:hypothetical protein